MPRSAKTRPLPDSQFPKETLPQLIRRALTDPRPEALVERVNGAWTPTSSTSVLDRSLNTACAIRAAGLQQGDRVARMPLGQPGGISFESGGCESQAVVHCRQQIPLHLLQSL